ncbi:MAG: hypothetical protein WD032_03200 [Nitrospirales bacterium]
MPCIRSHGIIRHPHDETTWRSADLSQFHDETVSAMNALQLHLSSLIRRLGYLTAIVGFLMGANGWAADSPQTSPPNVFQPHETQHGYAEFDSPPDFLKEEDPSDTSAPYKNYSSSPDLPTFDHKPGGLFQSITFAESVEEDRTIRRGHILVPVNPTDTFPPSAKSVHLVFAVHEHLAPYQIIGRLFPEEVPDADASQWIDEDRADLALEDESGYLKFFAPGGTWQPGRYRVDVYVGYVVNAMNKMGTMRFSIK